VAPYYKCHIYTRRHKPSTVAKRLAPHFAYGRSRVLTLVPPDLVWVFFRSFPTPSQRGMFHITDKVNAGSVSTSQYLPSSFRTHPHRIFKSVWLKRFWKVSAALLRDLAPSCLTFTVHLKQIAARNHLAEAVYKKMRNPSCDLVR
jgi:hypothetical protein